MNIPERGLAREEILSTLEGYKQRDLKWESGQVLAMIYDPGREAREVVNAAYVAFMTENGLDPTSFPSLLQLETEVVRMMASLLRGDEQVVGNLTSGGTESIMLAVKTARDRARVERPEAPPLNAIGYRQMVQLLRGELDEEAAAAQVVAETRRLAKRQRTWFKRERRAKWLDAAKGTDALVDEALKLLPTGLKK